MVSIKSHASRRATGGLPYSIGTGAAARLRMSCRSPPAPRWSGFASRCLYRIHRAAGSSAAETVALISLIEIDGDRDSFLGSNNG